MLQAIFLIFFGAFSIYLAIVKKTFLSLNERDLLKLDSRQKDIRELITLANNKKIVSILLSPFLLISVVFFLYVIMASYYVWLALFVSLIFVTVVFIYIPRVKSSYLSGWLACKSAPVFSRIIVSQKSLLESVNKVIENIAPPAKTKLSSGELLELLEAQELESKEALLAILKNYDAKVSKEMTKLEDAKIVKEDESIGPILIDELHSTGQEFFLVRGAKKKDITGVVCLQEMTHLTKGGKVKDIADKRLFYVNKDDAIIDIINAVIKTKSLFFVVIDDEQEMVGVISFRKIIKQLLGQKVENDLDTYANPETSTIQTEEKDV